MRALILVFLATPLAIQDNSFLIEEAYNQEPGVIQYIANATIDDGDVVATFTNEIPVTGQRHQFSYTLSGTHFDGKSRFGDTLVNYRYQLMGDGASALAIAPRVSLLIPSGDKWGYELNLPVSVAHNDRLVTHWNAGVTSADTTEWFAGGSVIGAVREKFHLMLETRWTEDELIVSPGIRWAWDLKNGFQVVPGIAAPIGDETRAVARERTPAQ
jgi:hypothetical protein